MRFFKHYGTKWTLSALLPPPTRDIIKEPFAGAAGYSCRYGAGRVVHLYDTDPDTVAIWDWLLGASAETVLRLPVELGDDIRSLGLARPEMLLIQRWLTPHGSRNNWRLPPSMKTRPNSYWGPVIRSKIAEHLPSISRWQVIEADYRTVPIVDATWSVDAPYESNRRSDSYGHGDIDYKQLSDWCRALPGQVIVHEQAGARWLDFKPLARVPTSRVDAGVRKFQNEVVWIAGGG